MDLVVSLKKLTKGRWVCWKFVIHKAPRYHMITIDGTIVTFIYGDILDNGGVFHPGDTRRTALSIFEQEINK